MSVFNKLEFELFAPLSLEAQFSNIVNGLVKGESPDWQDEVNGIGIEVARAENRHIGYTNSISNKYLGKYRKDIPTSRNVYTAYNLIIYINGGKANGFMFKV